MKKRKYLVSLGPFRRGCIVAWWDSVGAEMHAASVVSGLSLVDEPTVVNSTMVEFQLAIGLRQKFLNPVEIQPTHPCSAAAPEGSAAMSSQAEISLGEQPANDIRVRRLSCRD